MEVTAEPTGAVVTGEQFVEQVPVAVLDIDELEPGMLGKHPRNDVVLGEFVEFVVGEHGVGIGSDAAVEQWMRVRSSRQRRTTQGATNGRSG